MTQSVLTTTFSERTQQGHPGAVKYFAETVAPFLLPSGGNEKNGSFLCLCLYLFVFHFS